MKFLESIKRMFRRKPKVPNSIDASEIAVRLRRPVRRQALERARRVRMGL